MYTHMLHLADFGPLIATVLSINIMEQRDYFVWTCVRVIMTVIIKAQQVR